MVLVLVLVPPTHTPSTHPQSRLEEKKRKEDAGEGRVVSLGRVSCPMISHFQPKFNTDQAAATQDGSSRAAAGVSTELGKPHRSELRGSPAAALGPAAPCGLGKAVGSSPS